jgi:hypothetical protein
LPFEIETEASADEPLLGLALRIDPAMTAELALAVNEADTRPVSRARTMFATPLDARLSGATLRLLESLSSMAQDGQFARIAKALRRLRAAPDPKSALQGQRCDVLSAGESKPVPHDEYGSGPDQGPGRRVRVLELNRHEAPAIHAGISAHHRPKPPTRTAPGTAQSG